MAFKYSCHQCISTPNINSKPLGFRRQSRFHQPPRLSTTNTSYFDCYNLNVSRTLYNNFWKHNLKRCFSSTQNNPSNTTTNPLAKYIPNRKKVSPLPVQPRPQPQIDLKTINGPEDLEALTRSQKKQVTYATWISIISRHSHYNRPFKCLQFIEKMIEWGFKPNLDIYIPLMQAFFRLNDYDYVFDIFELLKERRMHKHETVYNMLISAYGKNGDIRMMVKFLHEMEQEGIRAAVESYNNLLSAFMERKDLDSSLKYFDQMKSLGVYPNQETFSILIHTAFMLQDFPRMTAFFSTMESEGFSPGLPVFNQMMEACSRKGDIKGMAHYYTCMLAAGVKPDPHTFFIVGHALKNQGDLSDLVFFLDSMLQYNMQPSVKVMEAVLNQYAGVGDVIKVKSILQDVQKYGLDSNQFRSFNWALKINANPISNYNLLDMPDKFIKRRVVAQVWQAELKRAAEVGITRILSVLDSIKSSGRPVTIKMINFVMNYIKDLYTLEQLMMLVPNMQIKWDEETYNNLLQGYARFGDLASVGSLMDEMKNNNIPISLEGYAAVIKGYGELRDFRSVRFVFRSLLESGLKPNALIYTSLFSAFHRRVLKLRNYFNSMIAHGIKPTNLIIRDLAVCLAQGKQLHCIVFFVHQSIKYGYKMDYSTSLFIFQMLRKEGIQKNLLWFRKYQKEGITPIEPMWALVMQDHLANQRSLGCLETFAEMKEKNVPVTQLTVDLIALLHTRKYRWSQFGVTKLHPGYFFRKMISEETPSEATQDSNANDST